jgi:hypothetical protein
VLRVFERIGNTKVLIKESTKDSILFISNVLSYSSSFKRHFIFSDCSFSNTTLQIDQYVSDDCHGFNLQFIEFAMLYKINSLITLYKFEMTKII